ncbi:MAG: Ig-like domain-containing protein [Gemmatales bacterium]|nr:Ig-like domain-containing protein [Gemmatales bacterium]MDW8221859.1 Ig-like domain-containing protein [Gemmatales bacterium]
MKKLSRLLAWIIRPWLTDHDTRKITPAVRLSLEMLEERTLLSVNPIVIENQKPGNPMSEWGISGAGDPSIQGFATDISVNKGQTIGFKINTDSRNYVIDIYRMGYYGGMGARKIDSITIRLNQSQLQPAPIVDATTGLVDAGNWSVTATWRVPQDAVSGIYFAKLNRLDGSRGSSHIYFVVRDDEGRSDILVQTSDTTWQAYNSWGGKSLYDYLSSGGQRAFKVSYNRPFDTRSRSVGDGQANFVFWAEYPLVRWLEGNGYNVSYFTNVDTARYGAEILEHKVFITVGHDEYWSAEMWQNVQAARDAGVHMLFLAGNNIYWKVRWEPSIDGSGTPYRTLVCYKESLADAKIDPLPYVWTGLWRDPRFSPPADGGIPENLLGGTIFTVNRGPDEVGTPIEVPYEYRNLRIWRHTNIASLQPGQIAYLGQHTLGYEWNEDLDNGFRPAGQIRLSSTTQQVPQKLLDYGRTVGPGIATHNLTLYRARSGALVFSAGTVQWVWGLDGNHDGPSSATDVRMQQATVNLLADMGVQPATLQASLVAATPSTDVLAPNIVISNPSGMTIQVNSVLTLQGSASDAGGGVVAGVEVSWDGGRSWHPAQGTDSWRYEWRSPIPGTYQLLARAIDDSVNIGGAVSIVVHVTSDDVTPPAITNVTIDAKPTQAIISWLTNEPADTLVAYGRDPNNLQSSVTLPDLVTRHQVTITGLLPNTTYYARLSSSDLSRNRSWYPADSVLSFRTPGIIHDTREDFSSGTLVGGAQITTFLNGEVSLRASLEADFVGNNLPNTFSSSLWVNHGSVSVSGDQLHVEGAMVASTRNAGPGAVLEFSAKFLASPYQHIGFSSSLNSGPWLLFSTKEGSGLYARSYSNVAQETFLGTQWLGEFHLFRIEWTPNSVRYFINNALVAEHAISLTATMPVVASDYTVNGMPLDIDWIRIGPYETTGAYLSGILDAGERVFWDRIDWLAEVPTTGSLELAVRMGNTPTPDESWTSFLPLREAGQRLAGTSRYLQYRIQLGATNPQRASDVPKLSRIALYYSSANRDIYSPSVIQTEPAPQATVNTLRPEITIYFDELLSTSMAGNAVQVLNISNSQMVPGTVQISGNRVRWLPSEDLLAGNTYRVMISGIADLQGNRLSGEYSWTFSVAGSSPAESRITHTTTSDFQGGSLQNVIIAEMGNGSISLQPALWDHFNSASLSSQWSVTRWQSNGSVQLNEGIAQINGSALFSTSSYSSGRFVEGRLMWRGVANQHFGFAVDLTSRYWAIFSVGSDGQLYARTRDNRRTIETVIAGNWYNQYHLFRVEWLSNEVRYYVNNNLVATHALGPSRNLRVVASDPTADATPLSVDWLQMGPYATRGSYVSRVLDAGRSVSWGEVIWSAGTSATTSLDVYIRVGDVPQPDASWSPFILIRNSGDRLGLRGRYAQYHLVLNTNDTFRTPVLDSISLSYTSQPGAATHTTVQDFSTGITSNVMITNQSGGELQLRGRLYDDFSDNVLNPQWQHQSWSSIGGGPVTLQLSGGQLALGGGAIISQQEMGLVAVQAKLSFSNSPYQNFGLASSLGDPRSSVWILFGTNPDGSRLWARANVYGNRLDYDLGPVPTGQHIYRIVPNVDRIDYLIDGALVATIPMILPLNVSYHLAISDYPGTGPLIVDWVQVGGFPTQGTYLSPILIGESSVRWTKLTSTGVTPSGTAVIMETRTGTTPQPDSSWSSWTPVDSNGAIVSPQARYLQYRIILLSTDANLSPVVDSVRVEWLN